VGDPRVTRPFRTSLIPEEAFVQSVLLRTGARLDGRGITYQDWTGQVSHPRTLTSADVDAIAASGLPFARKVDPEVDADLLDLLDVVAGSARPGVGPAL
jgi:hypothetical protein